MMDRFESTTSCFDRSLSTLVDAKGIVIGFGFTARNWKALYQEALGVFIVWPRDLRRYNKHS